jgi:hypothetical protein
MRTFIVLVVIVYLVGIGVALAPTVRQGWTTDIASDLFGKVVQAAPQALVWPVVLYHQMMDTPEKT